MSMGKDFRDFILRGNVVDLAVGVVIGAAFNTVVQAFTKGFITPLIGIPGKLSVGDVTFSINGSKFLIGEFINTLISFLLTAAVVYFFVVRPMNWLAARSKTETPVDETTRECPECLSKIPIAARRCAFCTSVVTEAAQTAAAAVTSAPSR
jgi:large conductance mechanosensitive channel